MKINGKLSATKKMGFRDIDSDSDCIVELIYGVIVWFIGEFSFRSLRIIA